MSQARIEIHGTNEAGFGRIKQQGLTDREARYLPLAVDYWAKRNVDVEVTSDGKLEPPVSPELIGSLATHLCHSGLGSVDIVSGDSRTTVDDPPVREMQPDYVDYDFETDEAGEPTDGNWAFGR